MTAPRDQQRYFEDFFVLDVQKHHNKSLAFLEKSIKWFWLVKG